jgi:ABC-2 type transport system ATP-binding protein
LLVFLDEPTSGLDPQSRANLWEHIRALRVDLGTTVFLTTHYLEEADALCDRIFIIDHGRIVAAGTAEDLKRQIAGDAISLIVSSLSDLDPAVVAARGLSGATDVACEGRSISLRVPSSGRALPALLRELDHRGVELETVEVRRPSLDDVFLNLTGRTLRDAAA